MTSALTRPSVSVTEADPRGEGAALWDATRILLTASGREQLVPQILTSGRQILRAESAAIVLHDPAGGPGDCHLSGANQDQILVRALAARAEEARQPLLLTSGLTGNASVSSALAYALTVRDRPLGSLVFLRSTTQPDFAPPDLARGGIWASQAALALENARLQAAIGTLSITDELTGLYSRRFLLESMRKQIRLLGRRGAVALTCLMIDVDHLQRINEQFGHAEGDRALREVANAIRRSLRESDIAARVGGDEFSVMLPVTEKTGGIKVAEKLRASVGRLTLQVPVTLSIGLATAARLTPEDLEKAREPNRAPADLTYTLVHRADVALYQAKADGRDRICAWPVGEA